MISSKIVVSAAALAAAAIGSQAAASAATASRAHAAAFPAAFRSARHDSAIRAVLTDSQRYTVQPGDTLSSIGVRHGISWQALYSANRPVIGSNPNLIFAGQVLSLTGAITVPAQTEPEQSQPAQQQPDVSQSSGSASASGASAAGSFQQCVIQRESGGDAQAMNSSGHYGLYQFSQSAWDAAGGNPGDFGHASAAEQNQVFQNAYAHWGTSSWAPYDGC